MEIDYFKQHYLWFPGRKPLPSQKHYHSPNTTTNCLRSLVSVRKTKFYMNKTECLSNSDACARILELARAIISNDKAKVERIVENQSELVDCCVGPLGVTPLHLASSRNDSLSLVSLLISKGAQVSATDKIGRSALHYAAARGDEKVVQLLINSQADINSRFEIRPSSLQTSVCDFGERLAKDVIPEYEQLPLPECWGRSPLHQAVKGGHVECVKILLEWGANVNAEDEKGLTPLLLAGAGGLDRYEAIVDLLMTHGAEVNKVNLDVNSSALYHAVALGSVRATRNLLKAGAVLEPSSPLAPGRTETVLHVAATAACPQLIHLLLNFGADNYVNWQNNVGCTPLHKAAYNSSRDCLRLLMDHGGDISITSDSGLTVIDIIMSYIPRPINFLTDCLDSRITANNHSINDRDFKVNLDFTLLSPQGCRRQMSVVSSLNITSQLIQHPLVEAFVLAKWSKLRIFFLIIVFVHLSFIISLSAYILIWVHKKEQLMWFRVVLTLSCCVLLIHAATELVLMGKQRLRQFETWITLTNCCLSLLITLYSYPGLDCRARPVAGEMPCWVRHIASIVMLLSWGGLMSLIGRFPSWGYYALMFSVVLQNVIKVFLTFICLVIGFALSFSVQFPLDSEFRNPWLSLVRTTVMMTGEYDYSSLFGGNKTEASSEEWPLVPTSRVIFMLFVLLASVALMNLMIGLAVSDIQGLQTEGNIRRLQKQTDFVSHLEHVLTHRMFTSYVEWWVPRFITRHHIPTSVTVQPSTFTDYDTLPTHLLEALINIALHNRSLRNKTPEENNGAKDLTTFHEEEKPNKNLTDKVVNEDLKESEQLKQLLLATLSALNCSQSQLQVHQDETDDCETPGNAVCVNAMLRRVSTPKHPVAHQLFPH